MKKIDKFTSFQDLKSSKQKAIDSSAQLKKHNEFKKLIKEIYSVKINKLNNSQTQ